MSGHNYNSLPVYQNSLVLKDLSSALAQYLSYDSKMLKPKTRGLRAVIAQSLETDASLIPVTIAQVYQTDSPNVKLRNATFINVITRNILSYCNGLENDGLKEREYLQLLRREIKVFRKSFKQWRKSVLNNGDFNY